MNKIIDKSRLLRFGAHWVELLIADIVVCYFAGFIALLFNQSFSSVLSYMADYVLIIGLYTLCYVISFFIFQTYNSFTSNLPHGEFIRCFCAVAVGIAIVALLRFLTGVGDFYMNSKDIFLQGIITFIGMLTVRVIVKIHYVYYGKRSSLNGVYGLNDIALLNMEMKDLLHRKPIQINKKKIKNYFNDKTILITGAAGSIGSELTRQLASFSPQKLILIDQAESALHELKRELEELYEDLDFLAIVVNVCNTDRMENVFKTYRPEIVFHAAAYKHVAMMEENPSESILNNLGGTVTLADLSVAYDVEKFIMISTDKAVNPTNVMGCSKRICEIYCQSLSKKNDCKTQFITTRFGNVLGSNGSVVPIFRDQIRRGGPVKVTHPEIIRYFMLIPEACMLVMEAALLGKGGEIFVFDMGDPVKIVDLAKRMIRISGRYDIQIEFIGLRPGEKLYEELLNDEELIIPTKHHKIKVARVREYDYHEINKAVRHILATALKSDEGDVIKEMKEIVPEFIQ